MARRQRYEIHYTPTPFAGLSPIDQLLRECFIYSTLLGEPKERRDKVVGAFLTCLRDSFEQPTMKTLDPTKETFPDDFKAALADSFLNMAIAKKIMQHKQDPLDYASLLVENGNKVALSKPALEQLNIRADALLQKCLPHQLGK